MQSRDDLIRANVRKLDQLSTEQVQLVTDFIDFLLERTEEQNLQTSVQQFIEKSHTYQFLREEPELYGLKDLKKRYR